MDRAVRYLSAEIPKWHRDNACYSCHNNGDAVRALTVAVKQGAMRDRTPLGDTLAFLQSPETWDANGPDGPFKDVKLARIQFAAALAELDANGLSKDRDAMHEAARLVAELQLADGSWPADAEGTVGSPVTYGKPLATAMALRTLRAEGDQSFAERIARGRAWFEKRQPRSVLDAASALLALRGSATDAGRLRRKQALEVIAAGESEGGGWGPFVNAPPEVFDTAVVLLALETERAERRANELDAAISRGRAYLIARQNEDGSWPATTRPPGVDSYAQQVSTTGWALQALLTSQDMRKTSTSAETKNANDLPLER